MSTRFLSLILFSSLVHSAGAQGLVTLTDEDGQVVNGTLIHEDCLSATDTVSLFATLSGNNATTVNVRRYEVWPVASTNNFYCWGVCYLAVASGTNPTWVSQHYVDMAPGTIYNNFHAYHQPQGHYQTARFRFVWFDLADPTGPDSSWVDIDFCGQVGVEEFASTSTFELWPSPTTGQEVQITFAMDRATVGSQLVLYNVLGEPVRRMNLNGRQGRSTLAVSDLVPGVYFANMERQGSVLATRRLVVTR